MMKRDERDREREIVALARELPREFEPPPQAWEAIRSQLGGERVAAQQPLPAARGRFWQRPTFLAAAAILLIVASSAVTAAIVRSNSDSARGGLQRIADAGQLQGNALAEFAARENDYLQLVNTLVAAIEDESTGLSPETIAAIRANLLVIDAAILDARRALAEDPSNRRIVEILSSTYEKKLDLLRRTTAMARS